MQHLAKYAGFFHDGAIMNIEHIENNITLSISSAELDEDDLIFARTDKNDSSNDIPLSEDNSIQGRLHVEGVKKIIINDKPFLDQLTMDYDRGKIFDLVFANNSVEISIDWTNYPPKKDVNEFSTIEIEAEKAWWENIPNLESLYP